MAKQKAYTDIGHKGNDDAIWIVRNGALESVLRVTSKGQEEPWTHWRIWGGESKELWHGRYDVSSGFCSIVPPEGVQYRRPPKVILDLLTAHFSVFRFYYFAGGVESFSPNPKSR